MAAASGQPQGSPKKEITPEQKKLYAGLAVMGVLALAVGFIYIPGMLKGSSTETTPDAAGSTMATASNTMGAPNLTLPGGVSSDGLSGDGMSPGAGGAGAGTATTQLVSGPLARSRPDPFQQAYLIPTPPPPLPPPIDVPLPEDAMPVNLPGGRFRDGELSQPLVLPPVTITRLDETARRPIDAFPPRRTTEGASGSASPSFDKRLSGVVIGDGVRALLEIQGPNGIVTRNVQPGDEVDGITVLNIQRYLEGGRTVTRMLIRENGEEKTVELRASPQPMTGAQGMGGMSGSSGMSGMPGMPGAIPLGRP